MKKRFIVLSIFIGIALLLLVGRLGKIQIIDKDKYREISSKQTFVRLDNFNCRGDIYDRKEKPLTGTEERFIIMIEREKVDEKAHKLLSKTRAEKINNYNKRYDMYSTHRLIREVYNDLKKEYGAIALKTTSRYSKEQPAVHIIGYLNTRDETGACGIEKEYNRVLSSFKEHYYLQADGHGYLIPGIGIQKKEENEEKWGVLTTIDLDLQKSAERILKKDAIRGVIIVSDVKTGEILVSASSPTFNPYQVEEYLDSDKKEFLNKATNCQYPPGSIFKIIVTVAALKKGVVTSETSFNCNGYHEVGGIKVRCSTGGTEGHGEITLGQAFEQSCNSVFVQLGETVGAEEILKTARDFGLSKVAIEGLNGQEAGNLPDKDEVTGSGICNLSIGQGKLLVTPMQVQKMTQIIANNGKDCGLTLVKGTIEGEKGKNILAKKGAKQVIPPLIAKKVQRMMVGTVMRGTANNMNIHGGMTAGGKTGSAEASSVSKPLVHGWFTGFAPADSPEYAITVFVENGGSGRTSAVPIFEKMVNDIYSNK